MSEEIEKNKINQEITPSDESPELDQNPEGEMKDFNVKQIEPEEQEANIGEKNESEKSHKENLKVRIKEFSGNLAWKEDLLISYVENSINIAYYQSWTDEANLFFKRAAVLKKRLNSTP